MNCSKCGLPCTVDDILVCDVCDAKEHRFQVEYDGNIDVNEFIKKEVEKKK